MPKQLKHSILNDIVKRDEAIAAAGAESIDEYNERMETAQEITDEERNKLLDESEKARQAAEAKAQLELEQSLSSWNTNARGYGVSVEEHKAAFEAMVQEAKSIRAGLSGEALTNYEIVNADLFKEDKPEPAAKPDYDLIALSIDVANAKETCKKTLLEYASQHGLFNKTEIALSDIELLQRYENAIKFLMDSGRKSKLNIEG